MNLADCIDFARKNPVCYLATDDHGQPRVRAWLFWFADASGFYFQTLRPKDVFAQLRKNPRVEFCFTNNGDFSSVKTMRLTGRAEILDEPILKEKLLNDLPFLKAIGTGPADPVHQIFRIAHGEAVFWTMADILKEKTLERIRF